MTLQVSEKQLVRTVYALRDVLAIDSFAVSDRHQRENHPLGRLLMHSLRTKLIPSRKAFCLFELCQMFLESVYIEVLVEHTIVPTVQDNTVVIDIASDIYLLMQFLVSPCPVQLEPVCSHDNMRTSLDLHNTFTILLYQNRRRKSI